MEQMAETVKDVSYSQLQHFISESPWEASTGMNEAASDISRLFQDYDNVCLLVDESSHSKKGNKSVGVVSPHRLALGETRQVRRDHTDRCSQTYADRYTAVSPQKVKVNSKVQAFDYGL